MRILLAEDEPQIADFIVRGLTENGHSVDLAADGEEALHWPGDADLDLLILDVMVRFRDGTTVWETLRTHNQASFRARGPGIRPGPRFV